MIVLLAASLLVASETPIQMGGMLVHPSRLLVQVRDENDTDGIFAAHKHAGARLLRDVREIRWQVVEVEPGRLQQAYQAYSKEPAIEKVQFDKASRLAYTPNDPMFPDQWDMTRIKANLAWDTQKGSPLVKIAVMDTGIEVTHPDLAANIWVNPGEIPGNAIDDDNNGYVDDVNGYDFAYNDGNPNDVYGHGTACAGIAAAVQDNNIGLSGVAPRCKIVAIKAANDDGYFYDSANVPALVYIGNIGCKVVSMSFYSDGVTPAERDAIDYAWNHGVLPVCAAGNDNQVLPYYPAAYENTLAVAATNSTSTNNKASFSNWGTWVSVAAPGVSLPATSLGGGYTTGFAGTSGACPHVSGMAALVFSQRLTATNADVRAAIEDTAVLLNQSPYGIYTKYGLVDCQAALARISGTTSGSVPARLLYAEPVGGGKWPAPTNTSGLLIYGVGLEKPRMVRVLANGVSVPILARARNWVRVAAPLKNVAYSLEVSGSVVGTFNYDKDITGFIYAPTDAGANGSGSTPSGGFKEVYRTDSVYFTVTKRTDNTIIAHLPVRKIWNLNPARIDLAFRRYYQDNVGGSETIQVYDWSTASFPYGAWTTVATTAIANSTAQTISVAITTNPGRFIDPEGTIYVLISTSAPGATAKLFADSLRLTVK